MFNIRRRFTVFSSAIAVLTAIGCDTAPGPRNIEQSAPIVSDLEFSPRSINLDALPPGSIVDGVAHFSIDVEVSVTDADSDLESVYLFVLSPDPKSPSAAESIAPVTENGTFTTTIELVLPTAETGTYTVKVYASDLEGQLGNQATGSLMVFASSSPPVIEDVDMPDTVSRPNQGEPPILIPIVATVSDPEGLANILRVETVVNGAGPPLFLCDDGGIGECNSGSQSGDIVAGDGLFTLTIRLDASNSAGSNEFVFTAYDRSGLASEPVAKTLLIQ